MEMITPLIYENPYRIHDERFHCGWTDRQDTQLRTIGTPDAHGKIRFVRPGRAGPHQYVNGIAISVLGMAKGPVYFEFDWNAAQRHELQSARLDKTQRKTAEKVL